MWTRTLESGKEKKAILAKKSEWGSNSYTQRKSDYWSDALPTELSGLT